jgi:hypothetical protein
LARGNLVPEAVLCVVVFLARVPELAAAKRGGGLVLLEVADLDCDLVMP